MQKAIEILDKGIFLSQSDFDNSQFKILSDYNLLTLKPIIYVSNVDEQSVCTGNKLSNLVDNYAEKKKTKNLKISAKIESEIAIIENKNEKKEFLESIGLKDNSLSILIREGYALLDLITFFTSGPKETRAWTIRNGTLAPDAGAKIHTDFKKGFIRAEVISYLDFLSFKGELNCKDNGKLRLEGKEYVVVDGDIITFRFNV